ncbi:MAG TPA: hypothetical protein ENO22_08115 [candidate division Zixibacteria bacterium]|nr:hypothetical protein [candidate division Zixibacteria bacterium]
MNKTRLCSLVIVALLAVIFWSTPASALDHPWDGTKITDTLRISSSGTNDGSSDDDGGDQGVGPRKSWLSWFSNWIEGLLGGSDEDEEIKLERKNKAAEDQYRDAENAHKKLLER